MKVAKNGSGKAGIIEIKQLNHMEDICLNWLALIGFIAGFVIGSILVFVGLAWESIRHQEEDERGDHHSLKLGKPWKKTR